jgi:hypothetical protein
MPNDSKVAQSAFAHYFDIFHRQVQELANSVSEEQFFAKPFPYGNSIGNLVLHLSGNLNYYIGARIEKTDYVRDRNREFAVVENGCRAHVLAELSKTVSMVIQSLASQGEGDWSREYSAVAVDDVHDRFSIYLRCCVHFHHHIGQMIYLVKEWKRQS